MIAVITTMGGEIEGHGNALLAGGERLAVKGIRGFGRGKTGILADRPGPPGIHGGTRAARERGKARQAVQMGNLLQIVSRIERLDLDTFGRVPDERFR